MELAEKIVDKLLYGNFRSPVNDIPHTGLSPEAQEEQCRRNTKILFPKKKKYVQSN